MAVADIFRKMRGPQNLSLPPRPASSAPVAEMETPAHEAAEESGGDEESAKISAGYVAPGQRCSSCAHCDESSKCALYDFTCEPDGGCPEYESGSEASAVPPPMGASAAEME